MAERHYMSARSYSALPYVGTDLIAIEDGDGRP